MYDTSCTLDNWSENKKKFLKTLLGACITNN